MGLDFSGAGVPWDQAARWSYSGFMNFRVRLAKEIGIADSEEGLQDWWSAGSISDDPLQPLMNHSDCDGELSPEECRQIAPRLREIVQRWPDGDYYRVSGERLASHMEACADKNDPLVFC